MVSHCFTYIDYRLTGVIVHDLPQIYTKPSVQSLLDTLALLSIEPRSWECTPSLTPGSITPRSASGTNTPAGLSRKKVRSNGIPQYLTHIISSPLAWIKDDEEKEKIWDTASMRLCERSGRTGMGALTRTFRVPMVRGNANASHAISTVLAPTKDQDAVADIEIHEPALTEDNLGLKTWASSYVLARQWHELRQELDILRGDRGTGMLQILELGAGTGLVGIAAAAVLGANVLLTDLPEIVPNLAWNANSNAGTVLSNGGSVRTAVLDWSAPETVQMTVPRQESATAEGTASSCSLSAPLIVTADPIYSPEHPALLAKAIKHHLSPREDARVVVEMPIRDAYATERKDFTRCMQDIGLVLVREQKDIGYDDWSKSHGEDLSEVECWMTIWAWRNR